MFVAECCILFFIILIMFVLLILIFKLDNKKETTYQSSRNKYVSQSFDYVIDKPVESVFDSLDLWILENHIRKIREVDLRLYSFKIGYPAAIVDIMFSEQDHKTKCSAVFSGSAISVDKALSRFKEFIAYIR